MRKPRPLELCRDFDPDMWFPVGRGPGAELEAEQAKAVCSLCPVRQACFERSMELGVEFGIWGGVDETERRILRGRGRSPRTRSQAIARMYT